MPDEGIFDSVLLPGRRLRTVSAREIERDGGPEAEELALFMEAFGLPLEDLEEPLFSPDEAEAFRVLKSIEDVWRPELGIQVARVYGRLLARIAQTELQIFRVFVERELAEQGDDAGTSLERARDVFAQLLPVSGTLLLGVHRRWLEHHLAQEAVREAETTGPSLAGSVDVSFLFCDLKDFTAFAEAEGDAAAVAAIDRFARVVTRERGPEARFTKGLGDGYMLVYSDASDAVAAGLRISTAMSAEMPRVHSSAHRGNAIAREGDYFGSAVNLAARLLEAADGDELVATRPTVQAAGDGFTWDEAGTVAVRGVEEPVEVFRLVAQSR